MTMSGTPGAWIDDISKRELALQEAEAAKANAKEVKLAARVARAAEKEEKAAARAARR